MHVMTKCMHAMLERVTNGHSISLSSQMLLLLRVPQVVPQVVPLLTLGRLVMVTATKIIHCANVAHRSLQPAADPQTYQANICCLSPLARGALQAKCMH